MKKQLVFSALLLLLLGLTSCSRRDSFLSSDPDGLLDQSSILKGQISGMLILEHSPYRVRGVIEIDSLSTLTIEPGVSLFFGDSSGLVIRGKLIAQGKKDEPVVFTTDNEVSNWMGIQFISSRQNSQLNFTIIEKISISMNDILDIGAITVDNSSVTLHNSIIRNNISAEGGGIYLRNSTGEIKNCIFMNNQAGVFGGAVLAYNSNLVFINNTVYKNSTQNFGGGLVIRESGISQVENNIFYKNSGQMGDPAVAFSGDASKSAIMYNFNGYGTGSPYFTSENNLRLLQNSPCIDKGDPDKSFNDPDNSRNDQGAYGGPLGDW